MIREQMYAALGATNEAILRTTAQEDLFQRVCDAAVDAGGIRHAHALFPDADGWLRIIAASGNSTDKPFADLKISVDESSDRGHGLAGTAFRTARSAVANDYQNDSRFLPWLKDKSGERIGSAVAVPVLREATSLGVFFFSVPDAGAFTDDVIALLERMVENVSFALGVFERDRQRKQAERANRRLTDMFAALSATNTAIVRAQSAQEMFDLVCQSVATSGRSLGTAAILLSQPDSHWLKVAAAAGQGVDTLRNLEVSIDPDHPRGQGLAGPAFRDQELKISYDLTSDSRTRDYANTTRSPYGGAAVPLILQGRSVGVVYFFFARTSGKDEEQILRLMRDIGENVSFALEGFRRDDEKDRYVRMFAALSFTNAAIMRARTREELYEMVAEAAGKGAQFTSTSILLADANSDYFRLAASSGPRSDVIRSRKYSPNAELPEGRALTGTAFRTGKPCIRNNVPDNEKLIQWPYDNAVQGRSKSGAALPLYSRDRIIGVLLFMAAEENTFTPEFVELLQGLSENVSLALGNFDSRDEKLQAEQQMQHMATHDALTGLPNRVMFIELLEHAVAVARREQRKSAVLFVDLDRFKIINDSLGHAAGDQLLVEVSQRLRASVRESDVVARLGGDEFVVMLNSVASPGEVEVVARKLLAALLPSVSIAGHDCRTTGSIGIAMYPDNGLDAHALVKNADIAMYAAKEEGKNDFRFYSADIKTQSIEKLVLETNLRHALELNQFSLHYQPKICVATGAVNGVEALLRWAHPELGDLPPMKFIPLAEETGLIIPIGRWVLRTACAQNVAWQREGLPRISIAVNLSPRQFQDEHLLRDLDDILRETGLAPGLLQLEITESMVMQNVERAIRTLDAIQSRGIRLAIDDFGTGYSSMSLMKQFPIDTIKIDRSFVRDLAINHEDRAIATAIISMGKALGLTVVAEGVETAEQHHFLREGACDELQGFLFSKPVPADGIPALLAPMMASPTLQPAKVLSLASAKRREPRSG